MYSFGAFILRGVSFFLIPVYTRYLVPAEYGKLDLLNTFSSTLEIVFSLGLFQVFYMEFFKKDEAGKKELVDRILSVYLLLTTTLYALTAVVLFFFHESMLLNVRLILIYAALSVSYLNFFQNCFTILLRLYERARLLTMIQVGVGSGAILMNVFFVVSLRIGIQGILLSNLLAVLITNLLAVSSYRSIYGSFKFYHKLRDYKELLRYSLVFIPGSLAFWLMNTVSRWMLLKYAGLHEVGIYSVAVKFSSIFDPLLIQPFLGSYNPRMLKGFSEGNFNQRSGWLVPLVIGFFAVAGFVVAALASTLVAPAYQDAIHYIPILVIGVGFGVVAQVAVLLIIFRRKIHLSLSSMLTGFSVSVLANYLLVLRFGGIGAAYGTAAGNLVWMLLVFYFNRREQKQAMEDWVKQEVEQ